jgi:hypothetical protein
MSLGGRYLAAWACALWCSAAVAATPVPPGNRNVEQPPVPGGSFSRTAALKTTFETKYRKVVELLRNDAALREKILRTAETYGLKPIHIVGAIVGEHTYNVDAYDRLQTYYVKAIAYLDSSFVFGYGGESLEDFLARPEFSDCASFAGSYAQWSCRETVWETHFRGQTVEGRSYPDDRFSATFFQPFYAGQTFGIGQLNPLTALKMSDLVSETGGLPPLDYRNPQAVYRTIMDPDMSLHYVAATLKSAIDAYRDIAGFDISGNPGITATLYNVGNARSRALALRKENEARRAAGEPPRLPQENYYGWLVNDRLEELESLF